MLPVFSVSEKITSAFKKIQTGGLQRRDAPWRGSPASHHQPQRDTASVLLRQMFVLAIAGVFAARDHRERVISKVRRGIDSRGATNHR